MPHTAAEGQNMLSYYERGAAAYRACQADARFGYFLYTPSTFARRRAHRYALCVLIHGSARTPYAYRDLFQGFADANDCIVLAPMFPIGITDMDDLSSYKFLIAGDLRYDRVLLAMVDEVRARLGLRAGPFLLHGFSGGGHFVHRFFYLHADQVLALSIGAPGMVTLLDETRPWHCGVADFEAVFGRPVAWEAMRDVPVQMVIGADDTETWEITIEPGGRYWMAGVNDAGVTRLDRLTALQQSFEAAGIDVRRDEVPGVGHAGYEILGPVKDFFALALAGARTEAGT